MSILDLLSRLPGKAYVGAVVVALGTTLVTCHVASERASRAHAIADAKAFVRDSITTATDHVLAEVTPRLVHDTVRVVEVRRRTDTVLVAVRATSARVDSAVAHLSESAQSDTTVSALVVAVRVLQADTARLFAAITTERAVSDSLRIDLTRALTATAARVVEVENRSRVQLAASERRATRNKWIAVVSGTLAVVEGAVLVVSHLSSH